MLKLASLLLALAGTAAAQQPTFDVASIHLSAARVQFERNGDITVDHGTVRLRDVSVSSCIQWAYSLPQPLVVGAALDQPHYDIVAKTAPDTPEPQLRLMLRALLADRFKLTFHYEKKELRAYTLTVSKLTSNIHPSDLTTVTHRENTAKSMIARAMTMQEVAAYLSDPLNAPLADATGLTGRYDFVLDFTPYVDNGSDIHPDAVAVVRNALKGELGLDLKQSRETFDVLTVDHAKKPAEN